MREQLSEALTRPRPLTPRVSQYLLANHEVLAGNVADWLRHCVGDLESYELELLFSPLFTPDPETHVAVERALGDDALEKEEVDALVNELSSEGLRTTLLLDGESASVRVPGVIVERYVRLLHLDAPLPLQTFPRAAAIPPEVRWYLRDPAWRRQQSRKLLPTLLSAAERADREFDDYLGFLTEFVRSHRPRSQRDCVLYLSSLATACEEDLRKHEAGTRSFFNDEIKATYGGKASADDAFVVSHRRTISMARALEKVLS